MEAIILWAFLAVVQMKGLTGGAAATQQACEEARQEAIAHYEIIAISECAPVTLQPRVAPTEKS